MRKNIKFWLMITSIVWLLASCSKDKGKLFEEDAMVYRENLPDSTDYTFGTKPSSVLVDSVMVTYRIIGTAVNRDRVINLVPNAATTATPGYHYKVGKAVIKANAFNGVVPIYVYRKPGLKDSTLVVSLNVQANDDFKPGYMDKLRYKFTLNDILSKPSNWDRTWLPYYGTYSLVKFKFIILVTGKIDWQTNNFAETRFHAQLVRNALIDYIRINGDMIDENGQAVFFP